MRNIQASLFDLLSFAVPAFTEEHFRLASAFEAIRIEDSVEFVRRRTGRPPADRRGLARLFLAKSVLGIPTTKAMRSLLVQDRALLSLCGLSRVPSEATLSRAFESFASAGLADSAHERAVRTLLAGTFAMQVSRDSTAVQGRERPLLKPKKPPGEKGRPGRKKGVPPKPKAAKRQEVQLGQSWREALAELPKACDTGTKRNSKGHDEHWRGYKLHADVDECGLPLAAFVTSASLHDSQAAIPLMRMTAERAQAMYQLMDAAYVGEPIIEAARGLGQKAIVKPKGSKKAEAVPLDPCDERRYRERSAAERLFSELKNTRGGSYVRVRGWAKVSFHLMLGVLAVFALRFLGL